MKSTYNKDNVLFQVRSIEAEIDAFSEEDSFPEKYDDCVLRIRNLLFDNSELSYLPNGRKLFDCTFDYVVHKYLYFGWFTVIDEFEDAEQLVLDVSDLVM